MSGRIIVFDTTLRDGEQTPGVNLNIGEKLKIARELERLGVDVIEAGFPAASPGDFESVRQIAMTSGCIVAGLARCVESDIRKAHEALNGCKRPRIHIFLATSPIHMEYKLKKTPDEVLKLAIEGVKLARSLCEDVEFSAEDASRSDPDFLCKVFEAVIDAGANTINIPDTVGYTMPDEFSSLLSYVFANVKNIDKAVVSVHCHDDLGMAVANSLAALRAGARQVECTINGMGERAGNAALEEIIMGLETRKDFYRLEHNIDTSRIYRTSQLVSRLTSIELPACKAIVGQNAFSHESGIHQHGMLANSLTYEIMTPQSIGKSESTMVLGKHSGRHAFEERLSELGFYVSKDVLDEAFARFKELADSKKEITDRDLEALISLEMGDVPSVYELDSFQIQTGNRTQSVASVELRHNGEIVNEAAIGSGPVDAAFKAIERILGRPYPLAAYDIKAVTEGEDALGEVTVRVSDGERVYTGKGLASDIIESSIRAYINAVNRSFAQN